MFIEFFLVFIEYQRSNSNDSRYLYLITNTVQHQHPTIDAKVRQFFIIKQNSIRQQRSQTMPDAPIEINFRPISTRVIEILSRALPSFVVQKEAKIYKVTKKLTQNSKK